MSDADDFLERYRKAEEKRHRKAEEQLRSASGALRFIGVANVTALFDGSGDEGAIEELNYDPPPPAGLPEGLAEVLQHAFYEMLPGGWEINEGSFGTITLDTATGQVDVDQEWRESEDDEFEDFEGEDFDEDEDE